MSTIPRTVDSYFVAVPTDLAKAFNEQGFTPVIDGEKCNIVDAQYNLGDNLFFYINDQTRTKSVTAVLIGKDPKDASRDIMAYKIDNRDLKGPIKFEKTSWCSVFKAIVAPNETDDDFKTKLSVWTKGGSFFSPKKYVNLVYHCSPSSTSLPGRGGDDLQSGGVEQPAKSSIVKPAIGGSILVLSMLGLALGLYWKNRQRKKRIEEALAKPN